MESVILLTRIGFIRLRVIKSMSMLIKMTKIPLRLRMEYSLIRLLYELLFNSTFTSFKINKQNNHKLVYLYS